MHSFKLSAAAIAPATRSSEYYSMGLGAKQLGEEKRLCRDSH